MTLGNDGQKHCANQKPNMRLVTPANRGSEPQSLDI